MKRTKLFGDLYQLAGALLLFPDLTKGQRQRLTELLLDVLAEPDRYKAKTVRELHRMAMEP